MYRAIVLERAELATSAHQFGDSWHEVEDTIFEQQHCNNFGFNRADESGIGAPDKPVPPTGRKVFKEVCPMAAETITATVQSAGLAIDSNKLFLAASGEPKWNLLIARLILGRDVKSRRVTNDSSTLYANTSSAGSIIAFHKYQDDLAR